MKWKHNTVGVCIMNQRRAIRWGSGDGDFSEVVLPARIMTSNSAASLFASLDTVVPALQLEELKKVSDKVEDGKQQQQRQEEEEEEEAHGWTDTGP